MFEELFSRKTVNDEKASLFGFKQTEDGYKYKTDILNGSFVLEVTISSSDAVETILIEKATDEEYILYKTNAAGPFVGEVRNAVKTVLAEVANECFDTEIFKSSKAKEIIIYVHEKYGEELEFLWEKFPDNAIWRRKDNKKWYGALLTVNASKLGLDDEKRIEILDLRIKTEDIEATVDNQNFFAGYHMNKKHWYTLLLEGSIPTEEICRRIDESRLLAKK